MGQLGLISVLLLLLYMAGAVVLPVNVTVLNQTNGYQTHPDLGNALPCQNLTDRWGTPLLQAADDLWIPDLAYFEARNVPRGLGDCGAMSLQLSTLRYKNDLNPYSVTLVFMRHNASAGLPSEDAPFYSKTWQWPYNNYRWQSDTLSRPWDSLFRLQLNELGDDGTTRFNFRDQAFLPPGSVVWVSFYATVPEHEDQRLMSNKMYWVTLNNETGAARVAATFAGSGGLARNNDFAYRDRSNYLGQGWTRWTTALPVEREMLVTPTTNNMAWRVAFECLQEQPVAPTAATPTAPSGSNASTAPLDIGGNNSTVAPTAADDETGGNGTNSTNGTRLKEHTALHLMWIIALPVTLMLATIGVGYLVWRRRRKPPYRAKRAGDGDAATGDGTAEDVLVSLRAGDSRSEQSLFAELDEMSTSGPTTTTTTTTAMPPNYFAQTTRNGPLMMSVPTTYDHNNPFARSPNKLMNITIFDDTDED